MSVNILEKEYPIVTTTELYLYDKNLTEMPESIIMLSNLETLYFNYTKTLANQGFVAFYSGKLSCFFHGLITFLFFKCSISWT